MGLNGDQLAEHLKKENILINGSKDGEIRLVTHAFLTKEDIMVVLSAIKKIAI